MCRPDRLSRLFVGIARAICGSRLREFVSNEMVYPSLRSDDGPQKHILNGAAWHTNPILLKAERLMLASIEEPLTINEHAGRCDISKQELKHLFRKYLKTSPKSCYLTFRLQRAKELLLYGDMSVRETRLASGFSSPASYFRAFRERFATSAMNYRRAFGNPGGPPALLTWPPASDGHAYRAAFLSFTGMAFNCPILCAWYQAEAAVPASKLTPLASNSSIRTLTSITPT